MITRITLLFLVCLIGGQINYANAANYEEELERLQSEKEKNPVSARLLEHYNEAASKPNADDLQRSILALSDAWGPLKALWEYAGETINDHGQVVALPDES